MTWSSLWPDPALSVKANQPAGALNTTYIENTLGNVANGSANSTATKDHFWNVAANFDGRHRYINSPAYTTSSPGVTDPVIGAGMDCVLFPRFKTVQEAVAQQDVQYFLKNGSSQVMQMLGIRACIVFNWNIAVPTAPTIVYAHNCTLDASLLHVPASQPQTPQQFSMLFTNPLPSINYLPFGGAVVSGTEYPLVIPAHGTALSDVKTVNLMKFSMITISGPSFNSYTPFQVWAFVFGG